MSELLPSVITTTMQCSKYHPDEVQNPTQTFRQVSDKTLSRGIVTAADAFIDAKIAVAENTQDFL
jgi:hypothetical protein